MSFSRKELKKRAKTFLRMDYWSLFLALLLTSLPQGIMQFRIEKTIDDVSLGGFLGGFFVISIIIGIFIMPVLEVGLVRYVLNAKERGYYDIHDIFSIFKENYMNVVKIMFLRNLYIYLWSLLFVIPGIIKTYEYRFVSYALAIDTNIDKDTAFSFSNKYTSGEKFNIFVLDMSFIGWYFLGGLFFGIGTLFVAPYQYATNIELYLELKDNKSLL